MSDPRPKLDGDPPTDAKAVFLSYAREDAGAARQLAAALRRAGIEVWFDEIELRGGDAWDAKIRRQIRECALFVPVISASTQARLEGYFRIEWKLAAQRTYAMAAAKPFLLPVVIDAIPDTGAHVPEEFYSVQWTQLPAIAGAAGNADDNKGLDLFCQRVQRLVNGAATAVPPGIGSHPLTPGVLREAARTITSTRTVSFSPLALGLALLVAVAAIGIFWLGRDPATPAKPEVASNPASRATPPSVLPAPAPDAPDARSVAVLPFANRSDDKNNEYFSDGISEELLNVLAKIPGLRVAARTSAFYFKGQNVPVSEIAQKLGVAYVVEGSVRKDGSRVRISVQLVKAADGFPVWSDTFERELVNIFALQDEIAALIARSLRLEIGVAATRRDEVHPEAYQSYLEGRQAWSRRTPIDLDRAEECFERALALAPGFARAVLGRADVWLIRGMERPEVVDFGRRDSPEQARIGAGIGRALELEPDLPEALASLGTLRWLGWRFGEAERALRRALVLDPNYATARLWLGRVLQADGRMDEALVELKAAVELDPLSSRTLDNYSNALLLAGRATEGLAAAERAVALQTDNIQARARVATALIEVGRKQEAMISAVGLLAARPMRVTEAGYVFALSGLPGEAEKAIARMREIQPRGIALAYVLAALGRNEEALAALEPAAMQSSLIDYLYYWSVFDPIRKAARFQEVLTAVGRREAHDRAQAERAAWQRARGAKK